MRKTCAVTMLAGLGLAGCVPPPAAAPPSSTLPPPTSYTPVGLEAVLGATAASLVAQFGAPDLDAAALISLLRLDVRVALWPLRRRDAQADAGLPKIGTSYEYISDAMQEVTDFEAIAGRGVAATVEGARIHVGGPRMLEYLEVDLPADLRPRNRRGQDAHPRRMDRAECLRHGTGGRGRCGRHHTDDEDRPFSRVVQYADGIARQRRGQPGARACRAGPVAAGIQAAPRSGVDGGSRRRDARDRRQAGRRGRHRHRQDLCLPAACAPLRPQDDHRDGHPRAAGPAVSSRPGTAGRRSRPYAAIRFPGARCTS